jgi:hypothetical protein
MNKILLSVLFIACLLGLAGYSLYRYYFAELMANAIVNETLPPFAPKRTQNKIKEISVPLNNGTEAVLRRMHDSEISIDQVVKAIDNTTEEEAYDLLDDLNKAKPNNPNEVFDIAKRHLMVDFDIETFRKPFNDHVKMKDIRQAIQYANYNRKSKDIDFVTAKVIFKNIVIRKEEEYALSSKQ